MGIQNHCQDELAKTIRYQFQAALWAGIRDVRGDAGSHHD